MEKRYQVFVSSTYDDLRDERQEVMQALLELDCIPAGMELFPAANEDQWTLIKNVIDDCDYYMVVIGGRYGSLGPTGISFTQMEYEYAVAQNKPIIAFLHKDPSQISVKKTEKSAEGQQKLLEFRELAQQKMCKFWTSPVDLGSVVSRSLVKLIKTNPAVGWVKADLLPDISTAEEILRLRQKIEDLQNQLHEVEESVASETSELAQGDDVFQINFEVGAHLASKYTADFKYSAVCNVSWNDIFSSISHHLIDEASDLALIRAINNFIEQNQIEHLSKVEELQGYEIKNFKIDDRDFGTIKVQLLALGLIAKSIKKKTRSVNDKSAYWMLTNVGEKAMVRLRAIRKKQNT